MTIHLDWGEAEFWQQYESVNESVIATADAAARFGAAVRFSPQAGPIGLVCIRTLLALHRNTYGERKQRDNSCGPTDFGS
jgi:hypothetical protein